MVSAHRDIPVNRDEFYPGFMSNKENAFYKELKARETVQNGGRKVIFLLIVHVILFSVLHLLLFIIRKNTIINAVLKLTNAKIHSFYSIYAGECRFTSVDTQPFASKGIL